MNITLTKILDLSTLVFPENKSWLAKFYTSWVPILSTRLRGGTFLKDPAYRRLSIHARREDSKSEALNPRCVCQQGQTGDQQVVLRVTFGYPLRNVESQFRGQHSNRPPASSTLLTSWQALIGEGLNSVNSAQIIQNEPTTFSCGTSRHNPLPQYCGDQRDHRCMVQPDKGLY